MEYPHPSSFRNCTDIGARKGDSTAEGWRNPVQLHVTRLLSPGSNQLAVEAVNAGDKPNPAGLIGRLTVEFASGTKATQSLSKAWKASSERADNWSGAGYDDTAWANARELMPFGQGLWGMLNSNLTLSPVTADPFLGHCDIDSADLGGSRIYLANVNGSIKVFGIEKSRHVVGLFTIRLPPANAPGPPVAYVHGELFGVGGVTIVPDNPRGERSMSIENLCRGRGEWNVYDVVCVDGTVKLAINGKFVNSIRDSSVRKGYLCLESEGSEIHFRNIRILELPPGITTPEPTAKVVK